VAVGTRRSRGETQTASLRELILDSCDRQLHQFSRRRELAYEIDQVVCQFNGERPNIEDQPLHSIKDTLDIVSELIESAANVFERLLCFFERLLCLFFRCYCQILCSIRSVYRQILCSIRSVHRQFLCSIRRVY